MKKLFTLLDLLFLISLNNSFFHSGRGLNKTTIAQKAKFSPYKCKRKLMDSYELWYEYNSEKLSNLMCPIVKYNCCSPRV